MSILKVPYNFVPLNKEVVSPHWIDHVSHDLPFMDGLSGTLDITLTAESPIFVRRGSEKPDRDEQADTQDVQEFEYDELNKRYFLPGSSVRGMIRSVVETLSFGRMVGRVTEARPALRDLAGTMRDEYLSHFKADNKALQCGWLRYDKGQYILQSCGQPGRIKISEIQEKSRLPIATYFSERGGFIPNRNEEKAAKRKYRFYTNNENEAWLNREHEFIFDFEDDGGRRVYNIKDSVATEDMQNPGRIVFTGQPGRRQQKRDRQTGELKWRGKHLEFIFWSTNASWEIPVTDKVMEDFHYAYFDDDKNQQSEDYKWRMEQLRKGEPIPVFFHQGLTSDGTPKVDSFGLSYLYKLPYKNNIVEAITNRQGEMDASKLDLADAIFGMVNDGEPADDNAYLKGRVQLSHFHSDNQSQTLEVQREILGQPRATFYPTYIDQSDPQRRNNSSYNTLMQDDATISGRKRYPVLADGATRSTKGTDEKGTPLSDKVFTQFRPLPANTSFGGQLHYHNLRKVELGAILSALTFHGTEVCRHQVGMAKPLGYGKVRVSITGLSPEDQQECMWEFETYMDHALAREWRKTDQINEILALTAPVKKETVNVLNAQYAYNNLGEFKAIKQAGESLPRHSSQRGVIGVGLDKPPATMRDKWPQDKTIFDGLGDNNLAKANVTLREKLKEIVESRKEEITQRPNALKRRREQQRAEELFRRKEERATQREAMADIARNEQALRAAKTALEKGFDNTNLLAGPSRYYWNNLSKKINDWLQLVDPVYTPEPNKPVVPKEFHELLVEMIQTVKNAQRNKDWKKGLASKRVDVRAWLGENKENEIFN